MSRIPLQRLYWLTKCEFKLRDQGTVLGFLWTLINPIVLFLVLLAIFKEWIGESVENYPTFLFLGILQWNYFSLATGNSIDVMERKKTLLKCFSLDGIQIVLSSILAITVSFFLELALFFTIGISMGVIELAHAVRFLCILPLATGLATGVSFILANLFLAFRDVKYFWALVLRIGFFITPVFYPISIVSDSYRPLFLLNPLTHLLDVSRDTAITGTWGEGSSLAYLSTWIILCMVMGVMLFSKNRSHLAESV